MLQKPKINKTVDSSNQNKGFSYRNISYDWIFQYKVKEWINRPLWRNRAQPSLAKTESGWGLLAYDGTWLVEPHYENLYRVVASAENSYPKDVFARLETENNIHLIDINGNRIASYAGPLDPYEAINRVKSLKVDYVEEYGSVFSLDQPEGNDYTSDLKSYARGRFDSVDWVAFEPSNGCDGWIVMLKGKNDRIQRQKWLVTENTIYQIPSNRIDFIRTSVTKTTRSCETNAEANQS